VSLGAGTAEEILFRGALQPRFGLILTSLAFGVVHMQYGLAFALLSIGVVGLVLGIYRRRINTTSSILIHSLYNLALFAASGL
jgi:membrane protease YdiL (CAAX protease family)